MSQVPAATRALAALRFLASAPGPVSAHAIASELGLPRSTTYHLLTAMAESGFVTHFPEEQRWGLGIAAFEVGAAYRRNDPLVAMARPLLTSLVKRFGPRPLAAQLGTLHGTETLYLLRVDSTRRLPVVTEVGVRLPAPLTASGRAILVALPLAQVRADFGAARAYVQRTGRGPSNWAELRALLEVERDRGYCEEDGFIEEELASVAKAVLNQYHYPVAAISVTMNAADWTPSERRELASAVSECARQLSRTLGER